MSGQASTGKQNGPRLQSTGRSGGLVGIDQEVVTLNVAPYGKLRVPARPKPGGFNPNSPVV